MVMTRRGTMVGVNEGSENKVRGWPRDERNLGRSPLEAKLVRRRMTAVVTIDCSITLIAVPNIVGIMITGCFLQVQ